MSAVVIPQDNRCARRLAERKARLGRREKLLDRWRMTGLQQAARTFDGVVRFQVFFANEKSAIIEVDEQLLYTQQPRGLMLHATQAALRKLGVPESVVQEWRVPKEIMEQWQSRTS